MHIIGGLWSVVRCLMIMMIIMMIVIIITFTMTTCHARTYILTYARRDILAQVRFWLFPHLPQNGFPSQRAMALRCARPLVGY